MPFGNSKIDAQAIVPFAPNWHRSNWQWNARNLRNVRSFILVPHKSHSMDGQNYFSKAECTGFRDAKVDGEKSLDLAGEQTTFRKKSDGKIKRITRNKMQKSIYRAANIEEIHTLIIYACSTLATGTATQAKLIKRIAAPSLYTNTYNNVHWCHAPCTAMSHMTRYNTQNKFFLRKRF